LLSIGKAQGGYYVSLAKDDYYTQGGEPNGIWHGQGAVRLGYSGEIDKTDFLKLCDGVGKDGEALTQNAGDEKHVAGWDLCFSCPKSLSVIWSQADFETRLKIQELQFEAVKKALDYLEAEAGATRRGRFGAITEKSNLVFATFEHGTNRNQEPQLHTHAIALNVGVREDGTTGTILSRPLYQQKMTAGALYRAELAHSLQTKLGLEIEKTKDAFEIKGVSKTLMDEFSSRRKEIVEAMKEANAKGADRAAYFTMATREKKAHVPRELLFDEWQKVGKSHGFDAEKLLGNEKNRAEMVRIEFLLGLKEIKAAIGKTAEKITERESYFSTKDLIRKTAQENVGVFSSGEIKSGVKIYLEAEAVSLGRGKNGEFYFTTKEVDALEKRMLSDVQEAKAGWHKKPFFSRETAIKTNLNDEQKKALLSITDTDGSSIKVVSGMAGTGKTTLLKTAKEVWENQGYNVQGVALAGKAAQGLQEGAGIKSETIHKILFEIRRGNFSFTDKTVLVVDEAGMVGTRQMSELIHEIKKANGQLILVGDEKQLQPIDAGNPFKAIGERIGQSELTSIVRQKESWARDAVKDFAFGEAEKGLKAYAERDLLKVSETRTEAMKELISDYRMTETKDLQNSAIIAGTRAEVSKLNQIVQAERIANGELGKKSIQIQDNFIYENERVLFTKNNRFLQIKNGDLGTVSEVDRIGRKIKVTLDNQKRVTIPLKNYEDIQLGYAVTTHKAQGITIDRAYILAGGTMQDRELSYVQMSRSREKTKIYTERAEVGDTIAELSKRMSRSRQKTIAQDFKKSKQKENALRIKPETFQTEQKPITYQR
jgi:Ti-type conjugative transfer relaxase TraA